MKKDEIIERYGEGEYKRRLAQRRAYNKSHREEVKATTKKWRDAHPEQVKTTDKKYREIHREEIKAADKIRHDEHPEQVKVKSQKQNRKGGKHYKKKLQYMRTGLQGNRNRIRIKHADQYRPYKRIIAPDSQLHHEWIPDTSEYRGLALVEADQHMHGFVDVIQILDGEITLLTEEEVRNG